MRVSVASGRETRNISALGIAWAESESREEHSQEVVGVGRKPAWAQGGSYKGIHYEGASFGKAATELSSSLHFSRFLPWVQDEKLIVRIYPYES